MSVFDLRKSMDRARARLGGAASSRTRAPRSDRGRSRLHPEVLGIVREALSDRERPRMRDMLCRIRERSEERGHPPPSRATVYKLMRTLPGRTWRVRDLPAPVRAALYNLESDSQVPGHQVAFYCFNYGGLEAMTFAAGLPWIAIYQALRLPGYRKKSRGPIRAVAQVRGI